MHFKKQTGISGEMVHLVKALATKSSQPEFSVHRPQNGRRELTGTSWSLTVIHTRAYILTPQSNIIKGCKSQIDFGRCSVLEVHPVAIRAIFPWFPLFLMDTLGTQTLSVFITENIHSHLFLN